MDFFSGILEDALFAWPDFKFAWRCQPSNVVRLRPRAGGKLVVEPCQLLIAQEGKFEDQFEPPNYKSRLLTLVSFESSSEANVTSLRRRASALTHFLLKFLLKLILRRSRKLPTFLRRRMGNVAACGGVGCGGSSLTFLRNFKLR